MTQMVDCFGFLFYFQLQMLFNYAAKKLISYDESNSPMELRENFKAFMDGLLTFPLDIPGTSYHACLQVLILLLRRLIKLKG